MPFGKVPLTVAISDHLDDIDVTVWAYVCTYFGALDGGTSPILLRTIYEDLGIAKRTLQRSMRRQEQSGFMSVRHAGRKGVVFHLYRESQNLEDTYHGYSHLHRLDVGRWTKVTRDILTHGPRPRVFREWIILDRIKGQNQNDAERFGWAYTSRKDLGKLISTGPKDVHPNTVSDDLKEMKSYGLIEIDGNAWGRLNRYKPLDKLTNPVAKRKLSEAERKAAAEAATKAAQKVERRAAKKREMEAARKREEYAAKKAKKLLNDAKLTTREWLAATVGENWHDWMEENEENKNLAYAIVAELVDFIKDFGLQSAKDLLRGSVDSCRHTDRYIESQYRTKLEPSPAYMLDQIHEYREKRDEIDGGFDDMMETELSADLPDHAWNSALLTRHWFMSVAPEKWVVECRDKIRNVKEFVDNTMIARGDHYGRVVFEIINDFLAANSDRPVYVSEIYGLFQVKNDTPADNIVPLRARTSDAIDDSDPQARPAPYLNRQSG
ncbi:hypothetical protein [Planomonospora venezuelensis]|uniref:Uncharacterized protein n=1 Tax=Planomonospora venezuelensis TaxID=1999 RepID=A0A841CU60_PLAVE|nr:hypothetical protein [Planomonospora venezuelensis]MBB5960849.1 hypothetical protein [Planomonospora venezuelensis]